jgi:hypothetical protein
MSIESRLRRIEKKLEPDDKGACFRFPLPEGGFIEVPGCRTLLDVLALADASRKERTDNGRN